MRYCKNCIDHTYCEKTCHFKEFLDRSDKEYCENCIDYRNCNELCQFQSLLER